MMILVLQFLASYMNDAALIIEELHNQGWDGNIYSGEGSLVQIYMK